MNVTEALAKHQNWLRLHRKPGTAAKYPQLLKPFGEAYGDRELASLTLDDLENEYLAQFSSLSPASRRNRIAALKSLFGFAEKFGYIETNPTRRLEIPERDDEMKSWLDPEQDAAVLAAAVLQHEQLIVWLLRWTGLRVSEACNLKWSDVDLRNDRLTVTKSKTQSGKRTIPIPPMLKTVLEYASKQSVYVLATKNGTPMKAQFAWRVVKRVGERVGIEGLHPHSLRRTYGSDLINQGVRLEVVSKLLGHSSTTITERAMLS
jgi:integrase